MHLRNSSDQAQRKRRNENFIGIWLHDKNSLSVEMHDAMITRLKETFDYIRVFDDILPFTSYILKTNLVANVIVIISSILHGPSMCHLVEQQAKKKETKLREQYVLLFQPTNQSFEHPMYESIDELIIKIGSDIECHPQRSSSTELDAVVTQTIHEYKESRLIPPLGVLNSSLKQNSIRQLSNESLRFIQFQSLVEIMLRMHHDENISKDDMLSACREYYADNIVELSKIKEFQDNYTARNVIAYYTDDSFCFRMQLGENTKAENFYRYMLKNEPNLTDENKGFLHFYIGILRAKERDYHGAIDKLNTAIPYFSLPAVTSETASCLTTLIANTSISKHRFDIYFNIGAAHFRTGNRREAKEAWEHALIEKGSPEDMAKVNRYLGELAHICDNLNEAAEYHKTGSESITKSSANEDVKHDYKRKYDEAMQLSNKMDERLKWKRQRTRNDNEPPN
ncbi:unnamed protein product [Adineta steineri]|uniref:Tetratricopeptide repeat protein n=1 Tax=Adineta steineri TaxID=433720 RepID=A0A819S636_9BILA|nr:unnamed protein product [Adineta steineri]CAF4047737.1 unnamed protein product [Adineta steineri]